MSDNIFALMPTYAGISDKSQFPAITDAGLLPGTSLLLIQGVLSPENYSEIGEKVAAFMRDDACDRLILAFSSPGGSVLGISTAVEAIRAASRYKPVIAIANHVCASAAYWLASQANKIFLASKTAVVGSIGVIATHLDATKSDSKWGFKISEFVTGTYKNVTSPDRPIDDATKAYYQSRVEEIYGIFVNDVASTRTKLTDAVIRGLEGADFIGQMAINNHLADGFIDFMEVIAMPFEDNVTILAKRAENDKKEDNKHENDATDEEKNDEKDGDEEKNDEKAEDEATEEEKNKKKNNGKATEDKERARILGILGLAGIFVPDNVVAAIQKGHTEQAFALSALKSIQSQRQNVAMLQKDAPPALPGGLMDANTGHRNSTNNVDCMIKNAADYVNRVMRRK